MASSVDDTAYSLEKHRHNRLPVTFSIAPSRTGCKVTTTPECYYAALTKSRSHKNIEGGLFENKPALYFCNNKNEKTIHVCWIPYLLTIL